jgi:hypothetical protein
MAAFSLVGKKPFIDPINSSPKPSFNFSTEFKVRVSRSLASIGDYNVIKVPLVELDDRLPHTYLNQAAERITDRLSSKYKIPINTKEVYTPYDFPPSKRS